MTHVGELDTRGQEARLAIQDMYTKLQVQS